MSLRYPGGTNYSHMTYAEMFKDIESIISSTEQTLNTVNIAWNSYHGVSNVPAISLGTRAIIGDSVQLFKKVSDIKKYLPDLENKEVEKVTVSLFNDVGTRSDELWPKLTSSFNKNENRSSFFKEFKELKLQRVLENDIYVEIVEMLKILADFKNISIELDKYVKTSIVKKVVEITSIDVPKGTSWGGIEVIFKDGVNVVIKVGNKTYKRNYKEMGFEDGRRPVPNIQWKFFVGLAQLGGSISWEDSIASPKGKKHKQLLSDSLKAYFKIPGDPFYGYKKEKSYKIKMVLRSEYSASPMTENKEEERFYPIDDGYDKDDLARISYKYRTNDDY